MMKRYTSKNGHHAKQLGGTSRWRFLALASAAMAIFLAISVVYYHYHTHPEKYPLVAHLKSKVSDWLAERKQHIQVKLDKNLAKAKQIAKRVDPEQPVHFEFYSVLPSMQITASQPVATQEAKKPAAKNPLADSQLFLNQAELDKDFAESSKHQTYVIQVGLYSNAAGAEKIRRVLTEQGFEADVVKSYAGERAMYRVQLGPYEDKEQVQQAERQLQERKVTGIVKKIEA
jgi:cell division protein FtsN